MWGEIKHFSFDYSCRHDFLNASVIGEINCISDEIETGLINSIKEFQDPNEVKVVIDKNEFDIIDITIKNETTPVSKPTKRGGVYFSDTTVYKINAVIRKS